ncbi:MAG: GSCFA domain-containing protein, partial [Dysgonamonadaceae bacterium]|nr:GSCFA domain-containing protein [Dysgonamonadaceae bacterium]
SDKVMMIGSCFAENISERMLRGGFTVDVNPFGIVYNPVSVANGLRDLIIRNVYTESDLFLHEGVYHSFSHHSRFSGEDRRAVLAGMNAAIVRSSEFLRQAQLLIITFGTANIYRLLSTGQVVSNCHKRPAREFAESRLTVEQITDLWNSLIRELQTVNPDLKILFTVSPIRHWKDGATANQLSKAVLLLAVNELIQANASCSYFPAYELLLDDLRDYRFYADDLTHPNAQAVSYIWEKFGEAYFEKSTRDAIRDYEKKYRYVNHRKIVEDLPK